MSQSLFSSHRQFRLRLRLRIEQLQCLRRGLHINTLPPTPSHPTTSQSSNKVSSLYLDSFPPTHDQCLAATQFFKSLPPRISWVANEWQKTNYKPNLQTSPSTSSNALLTPEIAFLGRSNSGKSSLLNALLLSPTLCRVGSKPGKTTTMHAWALAPSDPTTGGARKGSKGDTEAKLIVLDMPGYGHGSRDEWGDEITKYLKNRRQLKRAFVLINPKHGVKKSDEQILGVLRRYGISHQIVASKCDGVKGSQLKGLLEGLRAAVLDGQKRDGGVGVALDDVLAVGELGDGMMNRKVKEGSMLGIEEVRWAILRAAGLEEYAYLKLAEERKRVEDVRRANGLEPLRSRVQTVEMVGTGDVMSEHRLSGAV